MSDPVYSVFLRNSF